MTLLSTRKRAKFSNPTMKDINDGASESFDLDRNLQILVSLEYHGTNYGGWQRQGPNNNINYPSVQGTLEEAATEACQSFVTDFVKQSLVTSSSNSTTLKPILADDILIPTTETGGCSVVMARTSGRTDRAVHALEHHCVLRMPFSTDFLHQMTETSGLSNYILGTLTLPPQAHQGDPAQVPVVASSPFLTILNETFLPPDIQVLSCRIVTKEQCKNLTFGRKHYRYIIQQCRPTAQRNRPWPPFNDYTFFVKNSLNVERMQQGLQHMVGTHDFLSLSCQKEKVNTVRNLYDAKLTVMEPPFDTIPWFAKAYQKSNKTVKKKDRKKMMQMTACKSGYSSEEIVNEGKVIIGNDRKESRPIGAIFEPPNYGADAKVAQAREHFPQPEDVELLCLEFEGSGFLRHQVRRMVSVLIKIGEGTWNPDYVLTLLKAGDSKPLQGLTLAPGRALWKDKVCIGDPNSAVESNNNNTSNGEEVAIC